MSLCHASLWISIASSSAKNPPHLTTLQSAAKKGIPHGRGRGNVWQHPFKMALATASPPYCGVTATRDVGFIVTESYLGDQILAQSVYPERFESLISRHSVRLWAELTKADI